MGPVLATCTTTGRRKHNEDAVAAFRLSDGREALIVADGMGGHEAGDVASRTALEAFSRTIKATPVASPEEALRKAFDAAAAAVKEAATAPGREGMGTTLVAALCSGSNVSLVHAGDSPAVLVLPDAVLHLTREHTMVSEAMRQGLMTETEALNHPLRHAVLRALGHDDVEPELGSVTREQWNGAERAVLLLGSDGFFGGLGDDEILEEVWRDNDLQAAVDRLVLRSIRNGSDDNVTAAAIALGRWSPSRRRGRRAIGLGVLLTAILTGLILLGLQLGWSR